MTGQIQLLRMPDRGSANAAPVYVRLIDSAVNDGAR